ncbi:Asd/ArgC dimerization domain-containing protein, partial [Streptomyces sp. DT9]
PSLQVNARFARPIGVARAYERRAAAPGVEVSEFPPPRQAAGQDASFVGRIRADVTVEHGLALFVSNDNLRKGAPRNPNQRAARHEADLPGERECAVRLGSEVQVA